MELWWVLGLLVLLLALEIEVHDLVGQRAELIREVPLRSVFVPSVACVGGRVQRGADGEGRRSASVPWSDG